MNVHSPTSPFASACGEEAHTLIAGSGQRVAYSLDELGLLLHQIGATRVLLVVDSGAADAARAWGRIERQLAGAVVQRFEDFCPNPKLSQAVAAARAAAELRAEAVVAVGGGSCLDIAKLAAAGTWAGVAASARADSLHPAPALIAAPTTSGSGSEATQFAVAYDAGIKKSYACPQMRPGCVILDPTLVAAMPARLAAVSGLDALAQAVESLWAVGGTARSYRYAGAAGRLVASALHASVTRGDGASRTRMMAGAFLAGQAINLGKTTAAHAVSYSLTSRYGIAHGHAVALTLGWFGDANARTGNDDCVDPRGPAYVRRRAACGAALLGCAPAELPRAVWALLGELGLPRSLREAGVPEEALAAIAGSVNQERMANNPRRFDPPTLLGLLGRAWDAEF
ncbi:Phosphonoacetaldehyde reductase [Pirellulimonas nuda]|uniref:Phosphonoacetaldehyde reductase n=1 Tax=Pirellulimonas nuda TaxID=2528009 RepID=A0A518DDJ8_9BACT|nr:iron-containing alcohol dehydrogenase [Pirellulimonas nuda]QDU89533.1 Phosphonoacetaldehyde reductase [Pirellulimonas nuda]